jgi:hypothetical protein
VSLLLPGFIQPANIWAYCVISTVLSAEDTAVSNKHKTVLSLYILGCQELTDKYTNKWTKQFQTFISTLNKTRWCHSKQLDHAAEER